MATFFIIMFAVNYPAVLRPVISSAISRPVINGAGNIYRALVIYRAGLFIISGINYSARLIVTNVDTCAYPYLGFLKQGRNG
jgi:hypothetical protein